MSWNYTRIKQEAKDNGLRVRDFLALAPANDPFYTGRPSELDAATWFAELWARFGYSKGVHLRRIHYQIVSQDPPLAMPNGDTYANTMNCWNYLNNAAKYARYLDLVPGEAFVDRRNPDAIINRWFDNPESEWYRDPAPGYGVSDLPEWDTYTVPVLPELPRLPQRLPDLPELLATGYTSMEQPYLVEVWAEKTTMNDVLEPLCKDHAVNLITGAGELSITAVLDFLKRVDEAGLPARILYVSDFDPAGLGMPISVARKIEFYQRQLNIDIDIKLEPVVLTHDQVEHYTLPRVPVKDSDRRKAGWVAAYGAGQVELDALEALHPGALANIIGKAILNYYDPTLWRRARGARWGLEDALDDERQAVLRIYKYEIASIDQEYEAIQAEFEETRARFAELVAEFQPKLDIYNERMEALREQGQELYGKLYAELEQVEVDLEDFPLPDPDLPTESKDLLYASQRSYAEQLAYYKAHRHNAKQLVMEV